MPRLQSQEQKRLKFNYLQTIWTLTSIRVFWKAISDNKGGERIVLVWDNASYHICSKAKEFYTKNEI